MQRVRGERGWADRTRVLGLILEHSMQEEPVGRAEKDGTGEPGGSRDGGVEPRSDKVGIVEEELVLNVESLVGQS